MDPFERHELARRVVGASLGHDPTGPPSATGMQMCELVSAFFLAVTGRVVTPEEIWNYSPSGELFMVFEWYNRARAWQQPHRALPAPS